jgi:catechol 2,3-dioxygenase-like lactoylglutathione lyase family enzyme
VVPAAGRREVSGAGVTRRELLALLGAAAALPAGAAESSTARLLPVDTPGLDHLDVMVGDVEKTTRFYMGLFRTTLHAQPFQGAQRYFVLLGPLPEDRAVGYLAIGNSRGRGNYIGHFCTSVANWQRDSAAIFAQMKQRFADTGFGEFAGTTGFGGLFTDPEGIEIQFLPTPDTLVKAAVPSDLVPSGQGLVTPLRVDHVVVQVGDLARARAWYRLLYGRERRSDRGSATFAFRNGSHLVLRQARYVYGEARPRIASYGIRVAPFDRASVEAGIVALGGSVVGSDARALRLRDADGIELQLLS